MATVLAGLLAVAAAGALFSRTVPRAMQRVWLNPDIL
jgi:hypothetical protein